MTARAASTLPEPLLTVSEVGARLRMCERSVRAHKAALRGRLIGGKLLFRPEDVLAYEDAQVCGESAPEPLPLPVKAAERRLIQRGVLKRPAGRVTGGTY